jgi:hypothetical protein
MHQSDLIALKTSSTTSFQNSFIPTSFEKLMLIKNFIKIKINEAGLKGDAAGDLSRCIRNTNHSRVTV